MKTKKSTVTATFSSPVEAVWAVVTNNAAFDWRSDLSKIVVSGDESHFTEFTKDGFETEFVITRKDIYKRYEFDMKNKNMSGHWSGVFSAAGDGTQITFTEEVAAANPIMNLFVGAFLKKQQAAYIHDLKKVLGE